MPSLKKTALALCLFLSLAGCNWKRKSVHWDDYVDAQKQFFERLQYSGTVYVPEPQMLDKLDIDDRVMLTEYRHDPQLFQRKLDELHVDINTVLVRPIPANIRFLALEEDSPVKLWRLFMLTGDDKATLLEDGIHLRRKGFPERILGGPVSKNDLRVHGEMGAILWQPVGGRWKLAQAGQSLVWQVSISTIREIKKHEDRGPLYRVDCNDALRQFVQPFQPGESYREMILKVDVPVSAEEREQMHGRGHACELDLRP